MSVRGVGSGPRYNPNVNRAEQDVRYPKANDIASGEGAAAAGVRGGHRAHHKHHHKKADGGNNASQQGQQNQQMSALKQVLQMFTKLLDMISKLMGGQSLDGANGASGTPGAAGAPGGDSNAVAPGEPAPGGAASSMPDLTGGVDGANGAAGTSAVGGKSTGAGQVPWISQYNPSGAENGYYNGPANCGPTSMAMIARSLGKGDGMTDAQLINHLGQVGGTTADGSSVNGIVAMAQDIGANAEIHGPHADINWIDQQLASGSKIVANGDYYAEPGHASGGRQSGHYLVVDGKNADGTYSIKDPADGSETRMTAAELARFINSNPVNGGYCVAVS